VSTETTHKTVIVGMGQMGNYYLAPMVNAQGMGIDPTTITVVDLNPKALEACASKYPGIRTTPNLAEALQERPRRLLNLINSPSHLMVLQAAAAAGVPYVFSEKPVVPACDLEALKALDLKDTKVITGFVINYSRAVSRLLEIVKEKNLRIVVGTVEWGKDRFGNSRATAGTLDDEACHGVRLFRYMMGRSCASLGASWVQSATILRHAYVNRNVQMAARAIDSSFELEPVSHVQLHATQEGDKHQADLLVRSSFMRPNNEREVTFLFAVGDEPEASFKARLQFDLPCNDPLGMDVLEFGPMGGKMESGEYSINKLAELMGDFLGFTQGNDLDPRLCDL